MPMRLFYWDFMRILHFYKTYYPDSVGGVEQVINQLARASSKLGIQTDVLSLSQDHLLPTIEMEGHRAHRSKMAFQIASTGFSLSVFARFAQLIKTVDIVHYHYPWPFMDLVHFATRVNIPTLVTYHSDIVRQKTLLKFYRPLKNRFLTSVDRIVATSPNYAETSPVLARYANKVEVIPIGLDRSTYPKPSAELIKKWRDKFGGRFFLFVGMLRYYKGLHILLDALKDTTYPVVIVGSGPLETELKAQAARLGLKHIHFTGVLDNEDKSALLELCYAVLFPSHLRSEAFGISLLEGAMYGKPMISSEIGTGTSFINIDQETGLVVKPDDSMAFREAMQFLWENPNVAEEMGWNAAKRYEALFTAEKMAASYADLYKKLLQKR
jgi:glycosyltransferase involved in cell wall biosynthesis